MLANGSWGHEPRRGIFLSSNFLIEEQLLRNKYTYYFSSANIIWVIHLIDKFNYLS
jgi:hypothetical protein